MGESLPDEGRGDVEVYRVDTGNRTNELVKIDRENYGEFFGGDCYIISKFCGIFCRYAFNRWPNFLKVYALYIVCKGFRLCSDYFCEIWLITWNHE